MEGKVHFSFVLCSRQFSVWAGHGKDIYSMKERQEIWEGVHHPLPPSVFPTPIKEDLGHVIGGGSSYESPLFFENDPREWDFVSLSAFPLPPSAAGRLPLDIRRFSFGRRGLRGANKAFVRWLLIFGGEMMRCLFVWSLAPTSSGFAKDEEEGYTERKRRRKYRGWIGTHIACFPFFVLLNAIQAQYVYHSA